MTAVQTSVLDPGPLHPADAEHKNACLDVERVRQEFPILGPIVVMGSTFLVYTVVPFGPDAWFTDIPTDMPIAESELVAGYMTEYSGIRFLLFFIGEFASAGAFAALAATLFLGGWALPLLSFDSDYMNLIGPLVLFAKMLLVLFLVMWFRFTYPRFREDQLQIFAWKYLIPLSLANIVVTATLKVVF